MAGQDSKRPTYARDSSDVESDVMKAHARLEALGAMIQRLSERGNDEYSKGVNFVALGEMITNEADTLNKCFYELWEIAHPDAVRPKKEAANG